MNISQLKQLSAIAQVYQGLIQPQQQQQQIQDSEDQHRVGDALQLMGLGQAGQNDAAMAQYRQDALAQDQSKLDYEQQHDATTQGYLDQELKTRQQQNVLDGLRMTLDPSAQGPAGTVVSNTLRQMPGFENYDTSLTSTEAAAHEARVRSAMQTIGAVSDPRSLAVIKNTPGISDVFDEAVSRLHGPQTTDNSNVDNILNLTQNSPAPVVLPQGNVHRTAVLPTPIGGVSAILRATPPLPIATPSPSPYQVPQWMLTR